MFFNVLENDIHEYGQSKISSEGESIGTESATLYESPIQQR